MRRRGAARVGHQVWDRTLITSQGLHGGHTMEQLLVVIAEELEAAGVPGSIDPQLVREWMAVDDHAMDMAGPPMTVA